MDERERTSISEEVDEALRRKVREIEDVLWTFEWKSPLFGDVSGCEFYFDELADSSGVRMGMSLYVYDTNDDEAEELKPLNTSINVDAYEDAAQQVRGLIHGFLCHEADEQIWFDGERPYFPDHPQQPEVKV